MDWSSSGITNSFEYELLDRSLNHVGWLENVTGGTIEQSYRGDYRVTASLDIDGQIPDPNGYVRVWNVANLDGETTRTMLATLVPEIPGMDYALGRWTGSIDFYSGMKRMDTALFVKDVGLAKNRNIVDFWKYLVETAGSVPSVLGGVGSGKKTADASVFGFGTSLLSACHDLADRVGGYISVVPSGKVQLQPYVLPSSMTPSWGLQSDSKGMMLVGVAKDSPEVVNRVIARWESPAGKVWYATANVPASHPWSFANIGRIEAVSIDVEDPGTGSGWLQKLADRELAALSDAGGRYEVRTLFDPAIAPGTVGTVSYIDSPDDPGLTFTAFCSQREIELTPAMTTTLTLEELR